VTFIPAVKQMVRSFTRSPADATASGTELAPLRPRQDWPTPREIVAQQRYLELDVCITEEESAFWCFMKPRSRPSFTCQLLIDLAHMQQTISEMFARTRAGAPAPFDTFILGSRVRDVFNLGGDLTLFAEKIRQGDANGLREYAHACITAGYANYSGYDRGVVTIALMQGNALGGGFESALSCDILIAESHVKLGLPEILFNLFPGMGAYTYLSRRIGSRQAEEIILSGKLYTAEEMLARGAIDMVVPTGEGERAVREFILRNRSRHRARSALYKVRRRVNAVPIEELRDIADLWVEAALCLTEQDLRKMNRIAAAQDRLRARTTAAQLDAAA
jgi:DSF synthase